ncbi:putative leucine aminopeptidase 1 [Orchesella cincta]|uniref:Putative leucine aminopeptidase 1 n=1 Tax=Orchesella cincta TaxID=48709 RepID=A0A1D2N0B5_ORCCI|nr:putative leucine aminopeptidase 1 [Orchesella cincta]
MRSLQILLVVSVGVILVSSIPVEQGKRLIKTSEEEPAKWMTDDEVWSLINKHQNFIDITDHQDMPVVRPQDVPTKAIPTTLKYQTTVRTVLNSINADRIEAFVTQFSSYHNRYYQANTGVESQQWLLAQVQESVRGYAGSASVREFEHSWAQNSVIARLEGGDPALASEVIILGAHQDSINIWSSAMAAPGADDNASGSVTVLETLRAIVNSGFIPKRTIEFQWYAAEEVGLRGSAAIAKEYNDNGVNVVASGITDIGIYTDNVNSALTQFMRLLTDEYLEFGRRDRTCGYGCSDHVSFTNYGYPTAMPAEHTLHPQMHTAQDNLAGVSFTQVREFVKLAIGVVVEFGEPNNNIV